MIKPSVKYVAIVQQLADLNQEYLIRNNCLLQDQNQWYYI